MIKPFLKWPGGKSRVMPELLKSLPVGDCLFEPFVGGASVFLATDYRRYVLADINPDLINLYRCVLHSSDLVTGLAEQLFNNCNDKESYYKIREDFNKPFFASKAVRYGRDIRLIFRAVQFFYLTRHCYNGVVRYNPSGGFNVPYGKYERVYFPANEIRLFSEKAKDTKTLFLCASFQRSLQVITGNNVVVYCDPPYLPASKSACFTQYHAEPFTADHHRQLVNGLIDANRQHGAKVVISNSDTAETREIYKPFRLHKISVQRSVSSNGDRPKASEVIGVLPVCPGCGRYGGGCPDCGAVMGDATYAEVFSSVTNKPVWCGLDPAGGF
ncbi:adenine methylase [Pantoea ananatis]|nr:adenine methylase [Pantoea ananatis]